MEGKNCWDLFVEAAKGYFRNCYLEEFDSAKMNVLDSSRIYCFGDEIGTDIWFTYDNEQLFVYHAIIDKENERFVIYRYDLNKDRSYRIISQE